jgi:hypothetical protein
MHPTQVAPVRSVVVYDLARARCVAGVWPIGGGGRVGDLDPSRPSTDPTNGRVREHGGACFWACFW